MEYYLLEDWKPHWKLPQGVKAVALTHEAIYGLERASIPYVLLEDFCESTEIRSDADEILKKEVEWAEKFDQFMMDCSPEIKELGVKFASIYFFWLKHLFDNTITSSRMLKRFIKAVKPTKISFLGLSDEESQYSILGYQNAESLFSRLIEPLCKSLNIKFTRLPYSDGWLKRKRVSALKRWTRYVVFGYLYPKIVKFKINQKVKNTTALDKKIMILSYIDSLDSVYKQLMDKGWNIYLKNKQSLQKYISKTKVPDWQLIYNKFNEGDLNLWLNKECGADVIPCVSSRFKHFITIICPEIFIKVKAFLKYFNEQKIDCIMTHSLASVEDHAAFEAARINGKTKRVGFAHGMHMYDVKGLFYVNANQYDCFFHFTKEEAEHDNGRAKLLKLPSPQYFYSPYFIEDDQNMVQSKKYLKSKKILKQKKPVVVFVPIMADPWPNRWLEDGHPFHLKLVQWHRALVRYFSTRDDYDFVWKAFKFGFDYIQGLDVMEKEIEGGNYKNITYQSGKLEPWLRTADRVFYDIPSTAFFRAIYAGLPAMVCCQRGMQNLRPNMTELYKKNLSYYSSVEEGLHHVECFLNAKKEEYIVKVDKHENKIPFEMDSIFSAQTSFDEVGVG